VQPTHHMPLRVGMIVLHEWQVDSRLPKLRGVVRLEKKPPFVAEDARLHNHAARERGWLKIHDDILAAEGEGGWVRDRGGGLAF
jgi:hypothetical protein